MLAFLLTKRIYLLVGWIAILDHITQIYGIPLTDQTRCSCVPDQWHGVLSSTEREYDLAGGQSYSTQSDMYVYYDYTHKKFAMEDLMSGHVAVADYGKGYEYVVNGDECHTVPKQEKMRRMCLPDNSRHQGDFLLGLDIPVEVWMFEGPMNMSMRTTVLKESCMPVSEEVSMRQPGYASVTSSFYMNVQLGIPDKNLFEVPDICQQNKAKKSVGANSGQLGTLGKTLMNKAI